MREFKINDYISLKLEHNETIIYVGGQRFRQCKYLLLNIKVDEIQSLEEIESIDELVEKYGEDSEETFQDMKYKLTPEEEFVGHCSNMQMFAESGYNTQYLRANLAFPLLNVLTEAGDRNAQKVFKDEIGRRFLGGIPRIVIYLLEERYLEYLSYEERELLLKELEEKKPQLFAFILPFLMEYKDYKSNQLKKLIEKFDLENDLGIFQDMKLDEQLIYLRLEHINKLKLMIKKNRKIKFNNY